MNSPALLAIGDFSRATHMSVKMLRHYHQVGLLEPAEVDLATGYRRYSTGQISTAQIIRRFRDLEMPLDEIRKVLSAEDIHERNALINAHLARLENQLAQTRRAIHSVRELLEPGPTFRGSTVGYRHVTATQAASITEIVDLQNALVWFRGALAELYASITAHGAHISGPAGGIFANKLFTDECGQATVYLAFGGDLPPTGRITAMIVPAVELATILHVGPLHDIDLAYGTLAAHVAQHAISVDGPVREYYLVGPQDTPDESAWRTEIGWPVFRTALSQ